MHLSPSVYLRFLAAPSLDIHIRSEGCNDRGKTPNTCGIAYIRVNGRDHSPRRRGHNVVVVDATTGNAATKRSMFSRDCISTM